MMSRKRNVSLAVLTAILLFSPTGTRADPGADIFHGRSSATAILREELEVPASRFGCGSCHEQDGLGGREGAYVAPPITWRLLASANGSRRAYSAESFGRLLATGIDSEGRRIASLMPRYRFSPAEVGQLIDYLRRVEDEARTGIGEDVIRLAVPFEGDEEHAARQAAKALEAAFGRIGDPTLFGRRITVEVADSRNIANSAFAVVIPPVRSREFYSEMSGARVPVIAPLHGVEGVEDKLSVRALFASKHEQFEALHRQAPADAVVVAEPGESETADFARYFAGRRLMTFEAWSRTADRTAILPGGLDRAGLLPAKIDPGLKIFSTVDGSARTARTWLARGVSLVLADPRPARTEAKTRRPDIDRLADAVARTVVLALERSGRDLSRRRFMQAIDAVSFALPDWPPVDFGAAGLTGSKDVALVSLDP